MDVQDQDWKVEEESCQKEEALKEVKLALVSIQNKYFFATQNLFFYEIDQNSLKADELLVEQGSIRECLLSIHYTV